MEHLSQTYRSCPRFLHVPEIDNLVLKLRLSAVIMAALRVFDHFQMKIWTPLRNREKLYKMGPCSFS